MRNTKFGVLLVAVFVLAINPIRASGQDQTDLATKWKVNDADPKASIPSVDERNTDPIEFSYFLQDLIARGERAFKEQNWEAAVKFYEAMGFAVPDAGISFNRLCIAYAKLGKYDVAAGNCGRAVSLPLAKVIDHLRFIEYTLKVERIQPVDVRNVEASLKHLRAHIAKNPQQLPDPTKPAIEPASEPEEKNERQRSREELVEAIKAMQERKTREILGELEKKNEIAAGPVMHVETEVEFLECRFALRLKDAPRLNACVERLRKLQVHEARILAFSWAHAVMIKDRKQAEALLQKAPSMSIPQSAIESMRAQQELELPQLALKRVAPIALAVVAFGGIGLFLWLRKKRTEVAAESAA
jgi:tetratricopeptide (TPR) repeat protein